MAEVAVNSPQRVRLVLVGNIEFLEYLKRSMEMILQLVIL